MSKYDINYDKLSTLLLPMCLRGGALNEIAKIMLKPIGVLKAELVAFRAEKEYRMRHNSQRCYMRAVLNDQFDPTERGIEIDEEETTDNCIILHERETEHFVRIGRRSEGGKRMFRRGYGGSGVIGFWVRLPQKLQGKVNENLVHALVNMYKLAGIRYGVTYNN